MLKAILVFIKNNLIFLNFAIAIVNITYSTAINWSRRPKLKFMENEANDLAVSTPDCEMAISGADYVYIVQIKVANCSSNPSCIIEMQLKNRREIVSRYRPRTHVLDFYKIYTKDREFKYFPKSDFIKLPAAIPPNGYIEGFALLPSNTDFLLKDNLPEIVIITPQKKFKKTLIFDNLEYSRIDRSSIEL